jgi:hypothetical protein
MTPEQFEDEITWLTQLYTRFDVAEGMLVKWYRKLEAFDADLLHTAIDQYSDDESLQPPSLTILLQMVERGERMRQRQRAAEARKQQWEEQEQIPVEQRAAVLNTGMRQLLVTHWPEYRQYWPDVPLLEADA